MIHKIINWTKNLWKNNFGIKKNNIKALAVFPTAQEVAKSNGSNKIKMYLNDPTTPQFIVEGEVVKSKLPIHANGDYGPGFAFGTVQQQAASCKNMINHALTYMMSKTTKTITKWAATNTLAIMPRAGKDINAFYDRGALKFFFFGDPIMNKNIYACDSRSVVIHEFGHAYLDILRPDFWSTQASEIWAFHEAFGDMTAIIENLQHDVLIQAAIKETNGDLSKSNILTRLAAEMGTGLFHLTNGENGEPNNCLRDISISFNYTVPEKLPSEGPDNKIVNECHSFSRIFSGAFYEIIVKISNQNMKTGMNQLDSIKSARDTAAYYLISAAIGVPITVRLFDAIARQMMCIDKSNKGKYQEILNKVFSDRKIIQKTIKMLDVVDIDDITKNIKEPFEIQSHGNFKVVRTFSNKTLKLIDSLGVIVQTNNPLFNLEIEIPNQMAYYFDENDKLTETIQAQDTEIIDAAYNCLDFLHKNNLVGSHDQALFVENNGKLIRKQIVCKCKPNYCDPNAPEYGKPWKPANNSGCSTCHRNCLPQSCDCTTTTPSPPPKTGCYTSIKTGGIRSYKVGQFISRKVC